MPRHFVDRVKNVVGTILTYSKKSSQNSFTLALLTISVTVPTSRNYEGAQQMSRFHTTSICPHTISKVKGHVRQRDQPTRSGPWLQTMQVNVEGLRSNMSKEPGQLQ